MCKKMKSFEAENTCDSNRRIRDQFLGNKSYQTSWEQKIKIIFSLPNMVNDLEQRLPDQKNFSSHYSTIIENKLFPRDEKPLFP